MLNDKQQIELDKQITAYERTIRRTGLVPSHLIKHWVFLQRGILTIKMLNEDKLGYVQHHTPTQ